MSVKEIAMKMTLKGLPHFAEIFKNEEAEAQMCCLLSETNEAYQVLRYLEGRKTSAKNILLILGDFVGNVDIRKKLQQGLDVCWLKYKLFDIMNVMKETAEDEGCRKEISKYVESVAFPCSDFDHFLTKCFAQVDRKLTNVETKKIKTDLAVFKSVQMLFAGLLPPATENPDKSIEEQLKDLLSDYDYFPNQSLRKELQREIILVFLQCNPEARKMLDQGSPFKKTQNKLNQPGHLQTRIRREFGNEAPQAIKLLQEIKNIGSDKQREYAILCSIKAILFIIDVPQLSRLIAKTNAAKKMIADKDIIMLMGPTGSGKTTFALKLLGYSLKEASYNLIPTLVPVQQLAKEHKSFYTSPQAKSCTRYLSAATIPPSMYFKGTSAQKMKTMLCDGPGYGDSGGLEIDIANGVGVINALCECNTVRIVLLLPYNSLIADRLTGAVKVSQTIPGLFTNFQQISQSLVILFSKVPEEEQKQLPKMLLSKIVNLSSAEKTHENVELMLQMIQEASEVKQNFLDPFNGDYRSLLRQILAFPAVDHPKGQFAFSFAQTTRHSIDTFAMKYQRRILEYLGKHKYKQCIVQLQLLQRMSQILRTNNKLEHSYTNVIKHIQSASQQSFKMFQNGLKSLSSERLSEKKEIEMIEARKRVRQIKERFEQFGLQLLAQEDMQGLIVAAQSQFQAEVSSLQDSTSCQDLFARIRSFSTQLSPQFALSIASKMQKELSLTYKEASKALQIKDCETLDQALKKISLIQSRVKMISDSSYARTKITELKKRLQAEFQKCIKQIQQKLFTSHRLYQSDVKYCQESLKMLHTINHSHLLASIHPKRQIRNLIKAYESHGKKLIWQLQSKVQQVVQIRLEEYTSANVASFKDFIDQERQIQILMTFTGSSIQDQYEQMRETILKKLESKTDLLCGFIRETRDRIHFEVGSFIETIKFNMTVLTKSCDLLREEGPKVKLREIIAKEWRLYVEQDILAFSHIDLKLSNYKENFPRLERVYSKLRTYEKLSQLGKEFQEPINQLKLSIYKKLQAPFTEYLTIELPNLESQTSGTLSHYAVQKLNKFCYLAQHAENFLTPLEYKNISQGQAEVIKVLEAYLSKLKDSARQFCAEQNEISKHQYIKQPIRVLVMLANRQSAKSYAMNHLGLQIQEELHRIHQKLSEIHGKIERLSECQEEIDIQNQISLIGLCKHYRGIEEMLKLKEGERINFEYLYMKITQKVDGLLKNDADSARLLIRNNKPSEILFQNVATHYQQFLTLKEVQKRAVIIKQFQIMQEELIKKLRAMKNALGEDDGLIADQSRMLDFFDDFREALILQERLYELYQIEEDKKTITIDISIIETAKKCIIFLKSNADSVIQDLKFLKLSAVERNTPGLKLFQQMMLEMKCFLPMDHIPQSKFAFLAYSTRQTKQMLMQAMEQELGIHPAADAEEDLTTGLMKHLNTLKQKMKQKYHNYADSFTVDADFYRYYASLAEDKKHIRKELERNFKFYFEEMLKEFQEAKSKEQEEKARQKMDQLFENIPNEFSKYKIKWEKTLKSHLREDRALATSQGTFKELYDSFLEKYKAKNEDSFLLQFMVQCYSNNNQEMLSKMIETHAFINQQKSTFFKEASQSQFFMRRLKKEIKESGEIVKAFLREHRRMKEEVTTSEAKADKTKKKKQ